MSLSATYPRRCDDEIQLSEDMAPFAVREVRQWRKGVPFMDVDLITFRNALACDGSSMQCRF